MKGFLTFLILALATVHATAQDIAVTLSAPRTATNIDTIAVALQLELADTIDIHGFEFRIGYDSSLLKFYGVSFDGLPDCEWVKSFINKYADTAAAPSAAVRIVSWAKDSSASLRSCRDFSAPLLSVRFRMPSNTELHGRQPSIRFYWDNCHDNRLWTGVPTTVYIADEVYDADGRDLMDTTQQLPSFTGPHADCFIPYGDTTVVSNVSFSSTSFLCASADSLGLVGDINLDGFRYEDTDYMLFAQFFLRGEGVFHQPLEEHIATTDLNGDLVDTTLPDLVFMRYRMLDLDRYIRSSGSFPIYFEYEPGYGLLRVVGVAEEGIGAYLVSFQSGHTDVDSVVFDYSAGREPLGISDWSVENDTLRVLFVGGTPYEALIPIGRHTLFTIHHSGPQPLPIGERAVSINAEECEMRIPTDVHDGFPRGLIPKEPHLYQNHPNPFNPATTILFDLPTRSEWRVTIFNVLGREVQTFSGVDGPGAVSVYWDANGTDGSGLASGVYFCRLQVGAFTSARMMMIVK